jgi:predicted nucleotidyltransferase component of viral defense system
MSQRQLKNKSASVRAKLYNIARKENLDLNVLIVLFMQERILYRLSQSKYRGNFVLKGGLLLFAQNGFKGRPTQDMDLLGRQISNDVGNIKTILKEIFSQKHNDGLTFSIDTMTVENITEDANHNGIRVKIRGMLGNASNVISIDIGFGDIIIPKPIEMQYPCILDTEPAPNINVYTMESIIAEKFHAMIKLGIINSRMKDFCDIYMLSKKNNFEGIVLQEALKETFARRNTGFEKNPPVFSESFKHDNDKKLQWIAFLKKTKIEGIPSDFSEVLFQIEKFILPMYEKILKEDDFIKKWNHETNAWI